MSGALWARPDTHPAT